MVHRVCDLRAPPSQALRTASLHTFLEHRPSTIFLAQAVLSIYCLKVLLLHLSHVASNNPTFDMFSLHLQREQNVPSHNCP